MLPIALSNGEIPNAIKIAIIEYALWLRTCTEEVVPIRIPEPDCDEDFEEVHPVTRFRAAMWKAFNNPQMADAIIGVLNDCGMDIVVLAKEEKSRIIT